MIPETPPPESNPTDSDVAPEVPAEVPTETPPEPNSLDGPIEEQENPNPINFAIPSPIKHKFGSSLQPSTTTRDPNKKREKHVFPPPVVVSPADKRFSGILEF